MKPPITAAIPTARDMPLSAGGRMHADRSDRAEGFGQMLDVQAGQRQKSGRHADGSRTLQQPWDSQTARNLLQEKATGAGVDKIIHKAARAYGLDANLIASIIQAQSNFDPEAISPAGAEGLMQLMPATAAELGVTDTFDPEQNIMGASRYLKGLVERYDGDLRLALRAYTWGMGNVDRNPNPPPAEVERFVATVTASAETATARRSTAAMLAEMSVANHPQAAQAPVFDTMERKARQSGVDGIIRRAAETFGLDPSLIAAVIHAESDFDRHAVSRAGAEGLMQLMPATAAELGVTDTFDPEQNIMGASRYLKGLIDRYDGDLRLALAAYNWGMGNLERHPGRLPAETSNYIAKILALLPQAESDRA